MNIIINSGNTVCSPPTFDDSVNVFRRSIIDRIEYKSPLCLFYNQHGRIEKRTNNRKIILNPGDLIIVAPDTNVSMSSTGEVSGVSTNLLNISSVLPNDIQSMMPTV